MENGIASRPAGLSQEQNPCDSPKSCNESKKQEQNERKEDRRSKRSGTAKQETFGCCFFVFDCEKLSGVRQVKGNARKIAFLFAVELVDIECHSEDKRLRKNIGFAPT